MPMDGWIGLVGRQGGWGNFSPAALTFPASLLPFLLFFPFPSVVSFFSSIPQAVGRWRWDGIARTRLGESGLRGWRPGGLDGSLDRRDNKVGKRQRDRCLRAWRPGLAGLGRCRAAAAAAAIAAIAAIAACCLGPAAMRYGQPEGERKRCETRQRHARQEHRTIRD
ncbi:hypothetical protein J3F83DRAFT_536626 [Trichoderma novae-zelandiae]